MAALTITTKTVLLNGVATNCQFLTDGTNLYPLHTMVDETGAIMTISSGVPIRTASGPAAGDGVDATGVTPPTGASGIRGWLSGIWSLFNATIAAAGVAAAPSMGQLGLGVYNSIVPSLASGQTVGTQADAGGGQKVSLYSNNGQAAAIAYVTAAATTNATLVKNSGCSIYGFDFFNNAAAARFIKVYNSGTIPTAGAGTPAFVIGLAAGAHVSLANPVGAAMSAGFGYTITTGVADSDATACAINDVKGHFLYQ